jgi:hypothetical protein
MGFSIRASVSLVLVLVRLKSVPRYASLGAPWLGGTYVLTLLCLQQRTPSSDPACDLWDGHVSLRCHARCAPTVRRLNALKLATIIPYLLPRQAPSWLCTST